MISRCQSTGFEIFTFPRYPDLRTGSMKEKGVDQKICWEIDKTIFTNREPVQNKKTTLCAGDKDFMTVLQDIHTCNWAFELWLWPNSFSKQFAQQIKVFGKIKILDEDWKTFVKIGDKKQAQVATGIMRGTA